MTSLSDRLEFYVSSSVSTGVYDRLIEKIKREIYEYKCPFSKVLVELEALDERNEIFK